MLSVKGLSVFVGDGPDAASNVSDETHGLLTKCTRGLE